MEKTYLKINRADSVVVCLEAMKKGDVVEVDGKSITLTKTLRLDTRCSSTTLLPVRTLLNMVILSDMPSPT